jgi:hypothetical protein
MRIYKLLGVAHVLPIVSYNNNNNNNNNKNNDKLAYAGTTA